MCCLLQSAALELFIMCLCAKYLPLFEMKGTCLELNQGESTERKLCVLDAPFGQNVRLAFKSFPTSPARRRASGRDAGLGAPGLASHRLPHPRPRRVALWAE